MALTMVGSAQGSTMHGAHDGAAGELAVQQQRDQHAEQDLDAHRDEGEIEGAPEGVAEIRIGEDIGEILEPDPMLGDMRARSGSRR